ncbi:MAG: metallophosphoesterase [Promethearchaeota archaeon]
MLDNDTRILLVSDVHLGATETRLNQFTELLNYIIENDINLEAIIILGDFFDVMMDSYEGLSTNKKYKTIYNKLDTIKSDKKIKIIIALGNHEVPVTNSFFGTRTYDDKFNNRKDKLIRGFKKSGLKN